MYTPINGWTKESILQKIKTDFTVKAENENGTCLYRGEGGARCAVGLFIPDNLYNPAFEGKTAREVLENRCPALSSLMPFGISTLERLQALHDDFNERKQGPLKEALVAWVETNVTDGPAKEQHV